MKQIVKTLGLATVGGALTLAMYVGFVEEPKQVVIQQAHPTMPVAQTSMAAVDNLNFTFAAESSVNSVVHVNVAVERHQSPIEQFFYGGQSRGQIVKGSGSGVIIDDGGFIVTNNHVINGAQSIQVTLNDNRTFNADLVGADPTTDLALLKINADDLTAMPFGNSDDLRLGEWVLAVGNPFNLTSTVTAGIISAKGRNINIINDNSAIESFIQTDAVVNPGNSGGALVNARGELIGINTAISTHTGSFEGYSFAVPANIVGKVVEDLRTYGAVQRAFLGVNITDVSSELATEQKLPVNAGVYIIDVVKDGAAQKSGIEKGDIIVSVDGKNVTKTSELMEQIGRKRPGDEASVVVYRGNTQKKFNVELKNKNGTTELFSKEELLADELLGAQFEALTKDEIQRFGVRNGVRITDTGKGKLARAGVPEGFVIVKVNNQFIYKVDDVKAIIGKLKKGDGVLIQGFYPNGQADYFAFGL